MIGSNTATPEAPAPLTAADFKLPEGLKADDGLIGEFVDLLNKGDLSAKDRAQGLIDLQAKVAKAAVEGQQAAWDAEQKMLKAEVRVDPTIGGPNLDKTLGGINKMIRQYPEHEKVFGLLAATGLGNHIEFVKFAKWAADQLNEGQAPATGTVPASGERDLAAALYTSMTGNG